MVVPKGSVLCLLCRGAINLKSGNLERFKSHLESVHDALYDMDLVISLAFLEGGEKEGIVDNMFPRIKHFFKSIKHNAENYSEDKLGIEKRLLEEEEEEEDEVMNPRKKIRMEEVQPKPTKNLGDEKFSEDEDSIIDVAENDYISDDESDISDHDDDDDKIEVSPVKVSLSHCKLCQLSLPLSSYKAHMELHEKEVSVSSANDDKLEKSKDEKPGLPSIQEKEQSSDDVVDDKEYSKCEVCGKNLKRKNMSRHKRRIHGISNSQLGISNSQDILEKVNTPENEEKSEVNDAIMDDLNDDSIQQPSDKTDQILKSGPNAPTRCDICMKPMMKKSLARHMSNLHPSEKLRTSSSPISTSRNPDNPGSKETNTASQSIVDDQEYDYRCKICFTRFQDLEDVKIHVKEDHDIDYEDLESIDDKGMKVSRDGAMKKLKTELIQQETDQEVTTLDEVDDDEDEW